MWLFTSRCWLRACMPCGPTRNVYMVTGLAFPVSCWSRPLPLCAAYDWSYLTSTAIRNMKNIGLEKIDISVKQLIDNCGQMQQRPTTRRMDIGQSSVLNSHLSTDYIDWRRQILDH